MYFKELVKNFSKEIPCINNEKIIIEELFKDQSKYNNLFSKLYTKVQENYDYRKKNIYLELYGEEFSLQVNSLIVHLMLWKPFLVFSDKKFDPKFFINIKEINSNVISKYFDLVIETFLTETNQIELNDCISSSLEELNWISTDFNIKICNTINLHDKYLLAKRNERYNELIHTRFDEENMTTNEIETEINKRTNELVEILKTEDNCFHDYLNCGEGVNKGQLSEFEINVGPKPDLNGNIFPKIVNTNFVTDGLRNVSDYIIDSSGGRKALITNFTEVKTSGYVMRKLSLLCMNTVLDVNNKDCGSKNYMKLLISDEKVLNRFHGRYYNDGNKDILISRNDKHLIGKELNLRSSITCCSENGKICCKCYGELSKINNNIHVGILGIEILTSQLTQMMLSSKHLLKANSEVINWQEEFLHFFNVSSNAISLDPALDNLQNYSIRINEENISESGEGDFSRSIRTFDIVTKDNNEIRINSEKDLFLSEYVDEKINLNKSIKDDDGNITIQLKDFDNDETMFFIEVENNELSKHLHSILNLIDNKDHMDVQNKEEMLQKFHELLNESGIFVDSIHVENIIREILRQPENITKRPDWSIDNPEYQILRVSDAIMNSDSVIISLAFEKVKKQLYEPSTYEKCAPSFLDQLFK